MGAGLLALKQLRAVSESLKPISSMVKEQTHGSLQIGLGLRPIERFWLRYASVLR